MNSRTLMLSPVLLLLCAQSPAQNAADTAKDEAAPLYQVEVLVFRHADQSRTTPEISRTVEPEIDDVLDQQLARLNVAEPPTKSLSEPTDEQPFWQLADRDDLLMKSDAARLQRLSAYDLIAHFAWIQTAEDVAVARSIAVNDMDAAAGVSGTLKLYRKRYLHLAVDLMLGPDTSGPANTSSFGQFLPVRQASPAIVDSHRMRLGRTVYFDQPEFGALATVTKLAAGDVPDAG